MLVVSKWSPTCRSLWIRPPALSPIPFCTTSPLRNGLLPLAWALHKISAKIPTFLLVFPGWLLLCFRPQAFGPLAAAGVKRSCRFIWSVSYLARRFPSFWWASRVWSNARFAFPVNSSPVAASRDPELATAPSSALDRSAQRLPPVSSVPPVSSCPLVTLLGSSRRSGGLRRCSGPSPSSPFLSISEYLSLFRDWLDGQRLASIPSVSSFRGCSRLSGYKQETPASAWRKCCRALCACDGDMVPLESRTASTDLQMCRSSCELSYLSRLSALLPAVRNGSEALF